MKKSFLVLPGIIFVSVFVFIVLVIIYDESSVSEILTPQDQWLIKEKEIRSRLLSVPILLYHNIDGHGPFSIELSKLRRHFLYFKEHGYQVVSLASLIERLENPKAYRGKAIVLTFDDGYKSMATKLFPLAKEFKYPITLFVYIDFVYTNTKRLITWKELRELDKNGIDIQCHTMSHADLTLLGQQDTYAAKKKLFDELYLSKRIIEFMLDKKVSFLAYPYGKYNLKVIRLSQYAGYRRVFSTDYGSNIITRNNYCLNRHHVKSNFSLKTIAKIINMY
jgi:peptidoglycan/xylan/chitin deacetylase (PgdA/CDA1 family)